MLVRAEAGWKVWLTVPKALGSTNTHVGAIVTLTAEIKPSADDPAFAFGKRPRNASIRKEVE
jgi:hypothetical protein